MMSYSSDLALDVSRETREKLEEYSALVKKWQKAINLVSSSTVAHIWDRHIADSAQLFELVSRPEKWVDLGSGGGFPGVVIAILGQERHPDMKTHLVDSDLRKCEFLRTVSRTLDLPIDVHPDRIDTITELGGDVVSARALAPLKDLFGMVLRHRSPNGVSVLPKGRNYQSEIADAGCFWRFQYDVVPSITDPEAVILRVGELERV